MKKTLALSLALAALATSGAALAQSERAAAPQPRAERGAPLTKERATAMAERTFARLDANKDGTLDTADREARQRAAFARLDADGNGAVSFEEYASAGKERREQRAERVAERPGGQRLAARDMRRGRGMGAIARSADADRDGAVTQDEFRTAMLSRFDAADANRDGTVTREERRAMRGTRGPGEWRSAPRTPAG